MDFDTLSTYPSDNLIKAEIEKYIPKRQDSKKECLEDFLNITQNALSNNKEWFLSKLSHFVGEAERLSPIFRLQEDKKFSLMLDLLRLLQKNAKDSSKMQKGAQLLQELITLVKEQRKFISSGWVTNIFYVIGWCVAILVDVVGAGVYYLGLRLARHEASFQKIKEAYQILATSSESVIRIATIMKAHSTLPDHIKETRTASNELNATLNQIPESSSDAYLITGKVLIGIGVITTGLIAAKSYFFYKENQAKSKELEAKNKNFEENFSALQAEAPQLTKI
jgi:hypothetical protein